MAPHSFGRPSPPSALTLLCKLFQNSFSRNPSPMLRKGTAGRGLSNPVEPWMAERRVHGRIHSVLQKPHPAGHAPPKHDPRRAIATEPYSVLVLSDSQ